MTRRSPAVIALLLVATACVNAVVVYDFRGGGYGLLEQLFLGLLAGQISVACLWASFVASSRAVGWALPVAALAISALTVSRILGPDASALVAIFYGAHAALLTAGLWLMKRSAWWRRLSPDTAEPSWQFSLVDLLLVMTAGAVLFTILGIAMTVDRSWWNFAILTAQSVTIALAAACAAVLSPSTFSRLGILFGMTLLVATGPMLINIQFFFYDAFVQAGVLFVWLELGAIIPRETAVPGGPPEIGPTADPQDAAPGAADQASR